MKLRVSLLAFVIIAASLLWVGSARAIASADLSDEQLGRIQANCLSIKGSLNQLHATDGLLRVNRGQLYESLGTKLMNNFNSRLGNNGLDNKGLIAVTQGYKNAQTTFINDYISYEQQLSSVIRIDCAKDPKPFHDGVESARVKRAAVHTDVVRLHKYIDDYRSAVSDFMLNFNRVTGKN